MHIYNDSNTEIKKQFIELANSSWIPSLDDINKDKRIEFEYYLNYILEYYLNLLLNESDDNIKLL